MRTLLIFDWFGEQPLGLYSLPEGVMLSGVDGCLSNAVQTSEQQAAALSRVQDAIQEKPDYYIDPSDPICGTWVGHRVGSAAVLQGAHHIVYCGFLP